ncbi:MAG: hypothetical protein K2Z81_20490 [Cyanobacteria bacterium]|nr:hypothetical protein [Cyanobacteriota bacterium]
MSAQKQTKQIKFILNPALSAGFEGSFDADATDMLVAFNAKGDVIRCLEASDYESDKRLIEDHIENKVAASTRLVLTGFQRITPNNIRVACGIFEVALETAAKLKAKRISVLVSSQQFRGNLEQLASVIKCRTNHFCSAHPDLVLEEIEILCRNSTKAAIQRGLDQNDSVCNACFK